MKHTWANPQKEWRGFRPTEYTLESEKVWTLPLVQTNAHDTGDEKDTSTTVGEVWATLVDQEIQEIQSSITTKVKTATCEPKLAGPSFSQQILCALLNLQRDGINGFEASWYWYDSDSVRDDPHESYAFFVVHNGQIVRERMSFSYYHNSGFDPSVFKSQDQASHTWLNARHWDEANVRFWYRKFYQETRIGQLMVLRPDEPELFHYPEGRRNPEAALSALHDRLAKTHSVLWFLVVLVFLILLLLWR